MEYNQLLQELPTEHDSTLYWKLIKDNAKTILLQTAMFDSKSVSEDLRMSASKFSSVLPLLKAIARSQS